jgi:hypothetical protein
MATLRRRARLRHLDGSLQYFAGPRLVLRRASATSFLIFRQVLQRVPRAAGASRAAPPEWHMLFILRDGDPPNVKFPSVARMIRLVPLGGP